MGIRDFAKVRQGSIDLTFIWVARNMRSLSHCKLKEGDAGNALSFNENKIDIYDVCMYICICKARSV